MKREVRQITSRGDWLSWRQHDITASAIAALFDKHKYVTRQQLADEKRGLRRGEGDNPAMRAGRILEPAVVAACEEEHPDWRIAKATTYHRIPEIRLGATPDYWLDDDALIQCKTVSPEEWERWHGTPPLAYTLQTLAECMVTERARGVLAVLIRAPSYPLHLFDVPRHEAAERTIIAAVEGWWRAFDAGETPAAAPSDSLAADLDDGTHVDLSGDNELPLLLPERAELKTLAGTTKRRLDEIDDIIRCRIGAARTAWLPGWSLTYASQQRKEFTVPAQTTRVLRVKATQEQSE